MKLDAGSCSRFRSALWLAGSRTATRNRNIPTGQVKIVVGFTAGGGTDVAARVLALKLSEAFGQSFVVENRPGASGLIGSDAVAKSPADGYTLMVGSQTTLAVAPALYKKFTVDGRAILSASDDRHFAADRDRQSASPIKSIADLIAFAKSQSEPMIFGSGGVGTTPHMAGELFAFTVENQNVCTSPIAAKRPA